MADPTREEDEVSLNVRQVLADIGAEEAVAQLEARFEGFEQDIERLEERRLDADKARRGELDVMRARVDDALAVVRESVEEQREAWEKLEERLAKLVAEADDTSQAALAALRDELMPRVEKANRNTEEVGARLRGEVEAVSQELEARADTITRAIAELRDEAEGKIDDLRTTVGNQAQDRSAALAELDQRLAKRLDEVENLTNRRSEEMSDRIDSLRRELDAAAGELRAGMNLRAKELEDALADVHTELAQAIDDQGEAAGELERRWIEGTRDIARRIEEVTARATDLIRAEKVEREAHQHAYTGRLDEFGQKLDELEGRVGNESTRRVTETDQVKRTVDEINGRLEVLQNRVANVVAEVASDLTNRVAGIAAEVEGVRETSVNQEQRLASLDHLTRRVGELAQRQEEVARSAADTSGREAVAQLAEDVASARREIAALSSQIAKTDARTDEVATLLAALQESQREQTSLRQEVRELAARTSEMGAQLTETDKLARAAGQAIASAVRKARADKPVQPAAAPSTVPPQESVGPSVPAAERAPLFQNRQSTLRRDDSGRPVVGLEYFTEARVGDEDDDQVAHVAEVEVPPPASPEPAQAAGQGQPSDLEAAAAEAAAAAAQPAEPGAAASDATQQA